MNIKKTYKTALCINHPFSLHTAIEIHAVIRILHRKLTKTITMDRYINFAMTMTSNLQTEAAKANERVHTLMTNDNDRLSNAVDELSSAYQQIERKLDDKKQSMIH